MNAYNPDHIETPVYFRGGVKALVTDAQGRLLLLRRSDKVSRPHGWELPGGGIEAGEHPFQAVEREILEETGLIIAKPRLLEAATVKTKRGEETLILGYAASATTSDVRLSWEHDGYVWVDKADTAAYELPGLHRHIVQLYFEQSG